METAKPTKITKAHRGVLGGGKCIDVDGQDRTRMITLYGIRNCDTMKKAWTWLDQHGVRYAFHDYKKEGIDAAKLKAWASEAGWETLLNRAGATFRKLPEAQKTGLDEAKAIALMSAQPSMIKRPVLEGAGSLLVGFKPEIYAGRFRR